MYSDEARTKQEIVSTNKKKNNNKKMVTLTNKCCLKVGLSVKNVLKGILRHMNRENGTRYSLNDIKCVEIRKTSLSFGFGSNIWIEIQFGDLID